MQQDEFHLGSLIHKQLLENGFSKNWLAQQIGCCRTNIYKILLKPSMDTALLLKICFALKRNFFEDLSGFCKSMLEEELKNAG